MRFLVQRASGCCLLRVITDTIGDGIKTAILYPIFCVLGMAIL